MNYKMVTERLVRGSTQRITILLPKSAQTGSEAITFFTGLKNAVKGCDNTSWVRENAFTDVSYTQLDSEDTYEFSEYDCIVQLEKLDGLPKDVTITLRAVDNATLNSRLEQAVQTIFGSTANIDNYMIKSLIATGVEYVG